MDLGRHPREFGRWQVECVECSGSEADERPVRFRLNDHDYSVEELLDHWSTPNKAYFKVQADDGNIYVLSHTITTPEGEWSLASFRGFHVA